MQTGHVDRQLQTHLTPAFVTRATLLLQLGQVGQCQFRYSNREAMCKEKQADAPTERDVACQIQHESCIYSVAWSTKC